MIRKYCLIAIVTSALAFSPALFSMQLVTQTRLEKVQSALFITDKIAAVGCSYGCFLIFNPTEQSARRIELLHKGETKNLITDKKNRIGILCPDFFIVYDVTTKQKIWSQSMYNSNYSASFSLINDTIFVCHQEQLRNSKDNKIIELPHTDNHDNTFNFVCHPIKNEFLYPCSYSSLATKSYNNAGNQYVLNMGKRNFVHHASYNPDGTLIVVITQEKKIFLYNPSNKHLSPLELHNHNWSHSPLFIPNIKNNIMVFLYNEEAKIVFWDLTEKKEIASIPIDHVGFRNDFFISTMDFSPDGTQFIYTDADAHVFYIKKTPQDVINCVSSWQIRFIYYLLKKYSQENDNFLPQDIIQLLINWLNYLYHAKKTVTHDISL